MVDPSSELQELFDQTSEVEPHPRREQQYLAAQTIQQIDAAIRARTLGAPENTVEITLRLFGPVARYHGCDALAEPGMDAEASELISGQYADWDCAEVRRGLIAKLHYLAYQALFEEARGFSAPQAGQFSASSSYQPDLFDDLCLDEEFDDGIPF